MPVRIEKKEFSHPDVSKVFMDDNPLYASSLWLKFYENEPLDIFLIYNGNDPVGGFYLSIKKKIGLRFLLNPMFCPSNGFIVHDVKKEGYLKNTFLKEVHEAVADYIKNTLRPHVLFTSFPVWVKNVQPYHWAGMGCRPYYTYVLDLSSGEELFWERASNKVRKALKVTEKDFYFSDKADKEILLNILQKTYLRNKKNYPMDIPRRMLMLTGDRNSFYFTAFRKSDQKPIAFAHCIHDQTTAYQLFNGYDDSEPSSQTVKACFSLCIAEARRRGLKTFDFEGSMIPDVEKGIREFGGDAVPYFSVSYCPKYLLPFAALIFPGKF